MYVKKVHDLKHRLITRMVLSRFLNYAAVWLFVWGGLILFMRFLSDVDDSLLLLGATGVLPAFLAAHAAESRRFPDDVSLHALLDDCNGCGGQLMTAYESGGVFSLPKRLDLPEVAWKPKRSLYLLFSAVCFCVLSLVIPEKSLEFYTDPPLEIGDTVEELEGNIDLLEEENILEKERAELFRKELEKAAAEASGTSPLKTWAALDHLKEKLNREARVEAESLMQEALTLSRAEAVTKGAQEASQQGIMSAEERASSMRQTAAMMKKNLRESTMSEVLSNELVEALMNGSLTEEQMRKMAESMNISKQQMRNAMQSMEKSGMIDKQAMKKFLENAKGTSEQQLKDFLNNCKNGKCTSKELKSFCNQPGKWGVDRGPGDAPMTWTDGTDDFGMKFKEEALPTVLTTDHEKIGVTGSAPEVKETASGTDALKDAESGGGSATVHRVLPRHRKAVSDYFSDQ